MPRSSALGKPTWPPRSIPYAQTMDVGRLVDRERRSAASSDGRVHRTKTDENVTAVRIATGLVERGAGGAQVERGADRGDRAHAGIVDLGRQPKREVATY